jgi:hypothetical protein
MNLLYSPEQNYNNWGYDSDIGLIPRSDLSSKYDAIQDQNIESNKRQIQEAKTELQQNETLDEAQQAQLDANDALDSQQQTEIDANKENIIRIESELPTLDMEGTTLVIGKKGSV